MTKQQVKNGEKQWLAGHAQRLLDRMKENVATVIVQDCGPFDVPGRTYRVQMVALDEALDKGWPRMTKEELNRPLGYEVPVVTGSTAAEAEAIWKRIRSSKKLGLLMKTTLKETQATSISEGILHVECTGTADVLVGDSRSEASINGVLRGLGYKDLVVWLEAPVKPAVTKPLTVVVQRDAYGRPLVYRDIVKPAKKNGGAK